MLSDRPYMRGDYRGERTSVLVWLICAIIAGFVVQFIAGAPWLRDGNELLQSFGLNIKALKSGWVWTLLTHGFFHSTSFLIHIIGNLFALFLLGRELLPMLGSKRFLGLYGAATMVSGMVWAAVHWGATGNEVHIGATAAIACLFVVYACFFPEQELNFLLFFLFPVTLKPKHMAWTLFVFELFSLAFWEIPGTELPYGAAIASSAHLGGMLTGFLYYRVVFDPNAFGRESERAEVSAPRWFKRPAKTEPAKPVVAATPAQPPHPENLRAEVDRILDKISSQGLQSLTPEEKRLLDDARDQLSRR